MELPWNVFGESFGMLRGMFGDILAHFFRFFFKNFHFFPFLIWCIQICSEHKYNNKFYFGGMFEGILAPIF